MGYQRADLLENISSLDIIPWIGELLIVFSFIFFKKFSLFVDLSDYLLNLGPELFVFSKQLGHNLLIEIIKLEIILEGFLELGCRGRQVLHFTDVRKYYKFIGPYRYFRLH